MVEPWEDMMRKLFVILALMVLMITPVVAENVYTVITPEVSEYGGLYISVLCHHSLFSKGMLIQPTGQDWGTADYIELDPSGQYYGRYLPGTFDVWLLDGNGAHPEFRTVKVDAGYTSYVTFVGHAVTFDGEPKPTPTPVDCYWQNTTIYHPEVNHTEYVGEVNHTVWHPEVNHTITHPAVTHIEYRYSIDGQWFPWTTTKPSQCDNYGIQCVVACQTRVVIDTPAWEEVVVDIPAWEEIVIDVPGYAIVIVDIPAWTEDGQKWVCPS